MQNKKIYLVHNACPRRALDVERLVDYFMLNDCDVIDEIEEADYIIFITCGFIDSKQDETVKVVEALKDYKGELIVAGCVPGINEKKLREHFQGRILTTKTLAEIDKFFPHFERKFASTHDANFLHKRFIIYEKDFLVYPPYIRKYFGLRDSVFQSDFYQGKLSKLFDKNVYLKQAAETLSGVEKNLLTRLKNFDEDTMFPLAAHLRVSDGCMGSCSYCCIRNAIGRIRSKPLDVIAEEYEELLDSGHREFILAADDVGAYGLDIGSTFPELLERLSEVDEMVGARWSVHHLHPRWFVKYKEGVGKWVANGKIFHLLCAIQSGNQRILNLMNRPEDIREVIETLVSFKRANQDITLYTNIIAGFPSETDEEFEDTIEAVKQIRPHTVWIFTYCDIENANSYTLPDKISDKVKQRRVQRAMEVFDREGIKYVCDNNIMRSPIKS